MSKTCIVPNCNSGREISEKPIAFFIMPANEDLREKWIEAIPKTGDSIKATDMVCEKHFIETDIIRHHTIQDPAGKVIEKVTYDHPMLTDTAVPSIFPVFEPSLNATGQKKSQQLADNTSDNDLFGMLIDMISNEAESKSVNREQPHKTDGPEGPYSHIRLRQSQWVNSEVAKNDTSEKHPPLNTEASENTSRFVYGDTSSDSVKQTTNLVDTFQSDKVPTITEPGPILVQPTSGSASTNKVADKRSNSIDNCPDSVYGDVCCRCCCNDGDSDDVGCCIIDCGDDGGGWFTDDGGGGGWFDGGGDGGDCGGE